MLTETLRQIKADWAHLLDAPTILAVCREVGYQWRNRVLDPVMTVHLFMRQILHGHTACSHLRHLAGTRFTAAAFCQARTRLPLVVWQQLVRQTAAPSDQITQDEGRWWGHRPLLVDGSSFSMPDTPELQEHFGQPSGQRPGCGFPVAHILALFHAGTGFLLEVLAAPWHTHDMAQVAPLHPTLRSGDVLVGDTYRKNKRPFRAATPGAHAPAPPSAPRRQASLAWGVQACLAWGGHPERSAPEPGLGRRGVARARGGPAPQERGG